MDTQDEHVGWPFRPWQNQRLDPALYAEEGSLGFFTIRGYLHQKPFLRPELNGWVVKTLAEERLRLGVLVLVYCLMPDHLHLLLTPRKKGSSMLTYTDQFKGKSTNASWKAAWPGKLWQPRSFDHLLRAEEEFAAVALYILENPVRAGLVERPQEITRGQEVWISGAVGTWASRMRNGSNATLTSNQCSIAPCARPWPPQIEAHQGLCYG